MEEQLELVNNYLKSKLWMDFIVSSTDLGSIELIGRVSQSYKRTDIKISFSKPYLLISPLSFTFEGGEKFISMLNDAEAYAYNVKYDIPQGNLLFKLINTNIEESIIIAAEGIIVTIF